MKVNSDCNTILIAWHEGLGLAVKPSLNLYKVWDKARDRALHQDVVAQHHALRSKVGLVIRPHNWKERQIVRSRLDALRKGNSLKTGGFLSSYSEAKQVDALSWVPVYHRRPGPANKPRPRCQAKPQRWQSQTWSWECRTWRSRHSRELRSPGTRPSDNPGSPLEEKEREITLESSTLFTVGLGIGLIHTWRLYMTNLILVQCD